MVDMLQSKRAITKFQILVEIAAHQPNIRQKEIAEKIGITPQAISEYLKELMDDGLVTSDGRVNYSVTNEGIEWVKENAFALKRYAEYIMEGVISNVAVWTALAKVDIDGGRKVSLKMEKGLLWAIPYNPEIPASGTTLSVARAGEEVGVTELEGMIDLSIQPIKVCSIPRVEHGGSRRVNLEALQTVVDGCDFVCAIGVEALVALNRIGRTPDVMFGAKEGAIEAVFHGLSVFILCLDDELPSLIQRIEGEGARYEIMNVLKPTE